MVLNLGAKHEARCGGNINKNCMNMHKGLEIKNKQISEPFGFSDKFSG